ncbi:MAG: (R)-mandelonitrile lyase [Agriterribacter sp.]
MKKARIINVSAMLITLAFMVVACKSKTPSEKISEAKSGTLIFERGEKINNANFTGSVWLKNLVQADSMNQNAVGSVTFEPGARTKWHSHPAGQIILVLDGVGYYQEKDQPKKILRKGDVVKCPPGVPHWHGASVDTSFIQVAITSRDSGETAWLEVVTDKEYTSGL